MGASEGGVQASEVCRTLAQEKTGLFVDGIPPTMAQRGGAMDPLATAWQDRTFAYAQIERQDMFAIYSQQHKEG